MIFNNIQKIREYLVATYPKGEVTMASWRVSDFYIAIGIYEGDNIVKGVMTYFDPFREKYVLLDNFHADLSVKNYIEYKNEFNEAIALFEVLNETSDGELEKYQDEDFFFSDLD